MLVLLAAVLFLGYGSRTIAARFGDSHDGRNAAVWAAGSRSIREAGAVASRLGTRSPENGVYADHPPLIYVETAAAELVGFGWIGATRAPAWVGSLLLLALLSRLLVDRGLRPSAAGAGVLLMATTPMFLVYGTMLDTPVTSLPFAVALLLLWERARHGGHARPALAAAVAALAVLAGWQSLVVACLVAGWAGVRLLRRRAGDRRVELAFVAGAVLGGVLLLAWVLWAFGGSLAPLLDQFRLRTGRSGPPVTLAAFFRGQRRDVVAMFGVVGALGVAGLVVALRDRRTRGLAAIAVAVTLPYPLVFRSGAVNHDYWNYWFLLALVVGIAVAADRLLALWAGRGRSDWAFCVAATVLGAVLAWSAWARPPVAEVRKITGFHVAEVARGATLAPGQTEAWYTGGVGEPASWLALATRRPATLVPRSRYASLALSVPDDQVLVGEVRCVHGGDVRSYEFRAVASLVDRPPVIAPCP